MTGRRKRATFRRRSARSTVHRQRDSLPSQKIIAAAMPRLLEVFGPAMPRLLEVFGPLSPEARVDLPFMIGKQE